MIDRLERARAAPPNIGSPKSSSRATPETAARGPGQCGPDRPADPRRRQFPGLCPSIFRSLDRRAGGDLGWVRAEQLPAELAALVQQMPVGAISDPIPIPGGFSIVALVDKRQILVADPRDAVLSLMQMSIALPAGTTSEAQAQATRAAARRQPPRRWAAAAAPRRSAQPLGAELVSNDQVRVRELPPPLQQMLLNLSVGQATPAFGSAERISVLVLCGRDDPEAATAPSFEAIYNQLNEERVGRRAQRYLRDLRRDAVIDYR